MGVLLVAARQLTLTVTVPSSLVTVELSETSEGPVPSDTALHWAEAVTGRPSRETALAETETGTSAVRVAGVRGVAGMAPRREGMAGEPGDVPGFVSWAREGSAASVMASAARDAVVIGEFVMAFLCSVRHPSRGNVFNQEG